MANLTTNTYPSTRLFDFVRLICGLVFSRVRHPRSFSPGCVITHWIWGVTRRLKSDNIVVNIGVKKLLLVTGKDLSKHILDQPPNSNSYIAGPSKVGGMSFLASQALTISKDEPWARLRAMNDQVLSIDDDPELQRVALEQVNSVFAQPVTSADDIQDRMGKVMLGVVFGAAPAHLVEDINVLIGVVQNPVRSVLAARRQRARRDRFYAAIKQMWEKNEQPQGHNIMAKACPLTKGEQFAGDDLSQQVPHWMFTFVGSGTELLTRSLTMLVSRPDVGAKAREEIAAAGPLDDPGAVGRLPFLEACIMETCRLFPPVYRTMHVAPGGDTFEGVAIRPGMEIWHYFPVTYRDTTVDPMADHFEPQKWVDSGDERRHAYPNLFLSGARACPGEELIIFICKAAIAIILGQDRARPGSNALASDPLPFMFPSGAVIF